MPVSYAMDTTLYLTGEFAYNPWSVALKHLLYLDRLVFSQLWHSYYLVCTPRKYYLDLRRALVAYNTSAAFFYLGLTSITEC